MTFKSANSGRDLCVALHWLTSCKVFIAAESFENGLFNVVRRSETGRLDRLLVVGSEISEF